MLACKKVNKTRSYISRSSVHWRIEGRQSCGTTFYRSINSAERRKGGQHYCIKTTIIHKSANGSTARHEGVSDGGSTTKGDGDGVVRIRSCN